MPVEGNAIVMVTPFIRVIDLSGRGIAMSVNYSRVEAYARALSPSVLASLPGRKAGMA